MNKELTQSIEHWERVVSLAKAQDAEGLKVEGWHGGSCALCQKYADKYDCDGCPVAEFTGEGDCEGSPWLQAYLSLEEIRPVSSPEAWASAIHYTQKELDFLRSLE